MEQSKILHKKLTYGDVFCGADRSTYKWCQTVSDLDIIIPVSSNVTSSDAVEVKTTPDNIKVRVKEPGDGTWTLVMDGNFPFRTKPSEMIWNIEKGKQINIHIEKIKERWWESLLETEPKINLEEFELSRPLTDLTEAEEMTLHKIWLKQLEKRNGPERSPHS